MEAARREKARRDLLRALERFHREQPMTPDLRVDGLVARVQRASPGPSLKHRGGGAASTRADLEAALDALVADGTVARVGRRVRLASGGAGLGPDMRRRADELLRALRDHAGVPPRAEAVARRLGLPLAVVDGLRASGELVAVAPGIDYPADVLDALMARLAALPEEEAAGTGSVAAALGVSRRHAQALRQRAGQRDRRPVR